MYTHMCKSMSSKCYMSVYTVNLFFLACAYETQYTNMTWSSPQRLGLQLTSESTAARPESIRSRSYAIWADWVRLKHIQTLSDIKCCLYHSNQYTHLLTTQPIIIKFWTCLDPSAIGGIGASVVRWYSWAISPCISFSFFPMNQSMSRKHRIEDGEVWHLFQF